MFERFTQEARAAVIGAQEVARRLRSDRIGSEHVLLGALGTRDSVAARALARTGVEPAAVEAAVRALPPHPIDPDALAGIGIDLDAVRTRVERTFGPGALDRPAPDDPADRGRRRPAGHIPFDGAAKKMLEVALREALRLQHRRIDTGHLLLAVVRLDDTPAHRALLAVGLDPDTLRTTVIATWAAPAEA